MTLVWSEESQRDLSEIHDYISVDSGAAADRTLHRVIDATDRLRRFPQSGRRLKGPAPYELRELIAGIYRILYVVKPEAIVIVGVAHGEQDAAKFLLQRLGEK